MLKILTMMVMVVVFKDIDYGDGDGYEILFFLTDNIHFPPNRPLLKWSNHGLRNKRKIKHEWEGCICVHSLSQNDGGEETNS